MTTTEQPSEPLTEVLIPSFPNDVALNILARVPRQYHPVLSTVSKPIRSAVSSSHFFAVRSLLNCSESITYLNVGSRGHSHVHWFAVHRNPNPTNDGLLQYAPVPPIPVETPLVGSASAAMGSKIYVLGGYTYCNCDGEYVPSSDVWILDCRSHTWERGPSMRYPRDHAEAIGVDGKVYVVGGFPETLWLEVLDPAVGRWEAIPIPIPIPSPDDTEAFLYDLKLVDGKISFRLLGDEEFRLDRTTKTWEVLQNGEDYNGGSCVVDGVSYHLFPGLKVKRFDNKVGEWKELKHVEGGKPNYVWDLKLLNLKGRLVMVFGEMTNDSEMGKKIGIWCAEIDVMKKADGDWCGQTHWSEKVLLLPHLQFNSRFYFVCSCLSASL